MKTHHTSPADDTKSSCLSNFETELTLFKRTYPHLDLDALDYLRATDYERLDRLGHVYLDYTGGGLYAQSQIDTHQHMLHDGVFGNPHSANPTSKAMTDLVEHARHFVLDYFNADPDEYIVIFTQNASGALKLVGESYPFEHNGQYLLLFDNHNSVNGIREFARAKRARVNYAPVLPPELRVDADKLAAFLDDALPGGNNLFAFPAQSNFSGVQHDLEWIARAQAKGWDVLLDAAAFAPTNRLDLSAVKPDFISLSYYKIFGYPTGVGSLIARRDTVKKLRRPWFAGGTITIASVQGDGYYLADGEAGFEDGTIDYLNLPAVEIGLRHIQAVGIDAIHARVLAHTEWLLNKLLSLRHSTGEPLIHLYGPQDTQARGGTITVNFYDTRGKLFDYREVEAEANQVNISVRTGCFCNPGAGEQAHGLTAAELADCFRREERMTFEDFITAMAGKVDDAVGAVRVSVGIATNLADLYRFVQFAESFSDRSA